MKPFEEKTRFRRRTGSVTFDGHQQVKNKNKKKRGESYVEPIGNMKNRCR
jgi:hypothetical protein